MAMEHATSTSSVTEQTAISENVGFTKAGDNVAVKAIPALCLITCDGHANERQASCNVSITTCYAFDRPAQTSNGLAEGHV